MALRTLSYLIITWAAVAHASRPSCEGSASCAKVGDGRAMKLIGDAIQEGVDAGHGDNKFSKGGSFHTTNREGR